MKAEPSSVPNGGLAPGKRSVTRWDVPKKMKIVLDTKRKTRAPFQVYLAHLRLTPETQRHSLGRLTPAATPKSTQA